MLSIVQTAVVSLVLVVGIASAAAVLIGTIERKLYVVASGFYAPAALLCALAVEYAGHPGLWVGAVGCLLIALGVHARAMGRDL